MFIIHVGAAHTCARNSLWEMWSWCWPSAAENELGEQKGTTDSVPTVASSSSSLSLMRGPRLSGFGGKHALWLAESIHLVRSRRAEAKAGRTGAMALAN